MFLYQSQRPKVSKGQFYMLSDWKIWEFFRQNRGRLLNNSLHNAYLCPTEIITSYLVQAIKKESALQFTLLMPDELTPQWIENELLTPSLFSLMDSGARNFIIYDAQKIKPDARKMLWKYSRELESISIILFFSENDKSWNELQKNHEYFNTVTLLAPKFFEMDQLLMFMCEQEEIILDVDAQILFLELVEHRPQDFMRELKLLKSIVNEKIIKGLHVREHINPGRMNLFELASTLGKKQFNSFFKDLIQGPQDLESHEEFFRFLIGHLLKLSDSTYVDKKARPSKYDKEIKLLSTRWKEPEIKSMLNFCYQALHSLRLGVPYLEKYRQAYLATLR